MSESCTVQYKNSRRRKRKREREREARKGDDVFLIMITDIAADSEKKETKKGRDEARGKKEQEKKNSRGISTVVQQGYFFSLLAFILDEDRPDWHDEWHYPHLAILLDASSVCLLPSLPFPSRSTTDDRVPSSLLLLLLLLLSSSFWFHLRTCSLPCFHWWLSWLKIVDDAEENAIKYDQHAEVNLRELSIVCPLTKIYVRRDIDSLTLARHSPGTFFLSFFSSEQNSIECHSSNISLTLGEVSIALWQHSMSKTKNRSWQK